MITCCAVERERERITFYNSIHIINHNMGDYDSAKPRERESVLSQTEIAKISDSPKSDTLHSSTTEVPDPGGRQYPLSLSWGGRILILIFFIDKKLLPEDGSHVCACQSISVRTISLSKFVRFWFFVYCAYLLRVVEFAYRESSLGSANLKVQVFSSSTQSFSSPFSYVLSC
jgi:hypothetical protein